MQEVGDKLYIYIYIYVYVCVCAYYGVVNNSINDMFIPDIFTFSLNSIGYLSIILLLLNIFSYNIGN